MSAALVSIKSVFNEDVVDRIDIEDEVAEIQETLKEDFKEVKKEYDAVVKVELKEVVEWVNRPKTSIFRKNLEKRVGKIGKMPRLGVSQTDTKPGRTVKVPHTDIEVGDIQTQMMYWVPMEHSVTAPDQTVMKYIPVSRAQFNFDEVVDELRQRFTDGVEGLAADYSMINNWLLYKIFRRTLPKFQGTPDALYYAMYSLWPNKFTQAQFSVKFPDFCELYAEPDFDPLSFEVWKTPEEPEVVQNCRMCSEFICVVHGFRALIPMDQNDGRYLNTVLPLPRDGTGEKCSDDCWKGIEMSRCCELLGRAEEELEGNEVKICLDKVKIQLMPVEDGATEITWFFTDSETPFCELAADAVDPDTEHPNVPKTCAELYELVLKTSEKNMDEKKAAPKPKLLSYKQRSNNFQINAGKVATRNRNRRIEEFKNFPENQQLTIAQVRAKYTALHPKKKFIELLPVEPMVPCHHDGPCGPEKENCGCKENGICTHNCGCDANCPQRFPGCQCDPGQCASNECFCYSMGWECTARTCKSCACDVTSSGPKCQNSALARGDCKKTRVAPSRIAGNGLFIEETVEKGEFITEYVGENISEEETERRGVFYEAIGYSYIFNLYTGGSSDSYRLGNEARFANHCSRKPTVLPKFRIVDGECRIGFYAMHKLERGDELVFDYGYSKEHRFDEGPATTDDKENSEPKAPKKRKI